MNIKKLLLVFYCCCLSSVGFGQDIIYVSVDGNDHASGSAQQPLQSVSAALQKLRAKSGSDTAYIKIASGNYFLNEPIKLTSQDKRPIIFEGDVNNKPSLNGGIAINGWKMTGDGWWKCNVPEVTRYGIRFEQLYVNGQRATRACTPDKGWFMLSKVTENSLYNGKGRAPEYATQKLYTDPAYLSPLAKLNKDELTKVVATFYHKWDNTRKYIDYIQPDSGFFCTNGEGMKPWNTLDNTTRFTLENYKGALTEPGEWFLEENGDLYYIPRKGEKIENAQCYAPILKQLLIITGQAGSEVKDKTFRNISFDYTAYTMPAYGNEPSQAAAGIDAAIQIDWGENLLFDNCEVKHTGNYAFWFRRACHDNIVRHSFIFDIGAGGFKIGETQLGCSQGLITTNTSVENNIIRHIGLVFPCAGGVVILNSGDNKVVHNEIADLRYTGVSIGWMWGYAVAKPNSNDSIRSAAINNIVAYNHIHHIGWGELSDMGAVYTLGISPGTHIHNNVIHDVYSFDYGGWGLYTDEGSSNIVLENNLVYACKSGGFHQHYGENNILRNNIFAFGMKQQLQVTRIENHHSFSFTNNIILMDCGDVMSGPWDKVQIDMDHNCYWDMQGQMPSFLKYPFKEWKAIRDKHSIIADPMFKDPVHANFTFKSLKNVRKIGFMPFDYKKAGVEGSASWKEKALMPIEDIEAFGQIIKEREKEYSKYYN